jgi:hypothetical protein
MGEWEISGEEDLCARNETALQESYAAENLNINGAPLNIYKLLGVHEQGDGSVLSKGTLMSSTPAPGFPISNINNGAWRSFQAGSDVAGKAYVGVDFGIVTARPGNEPENSPAKPNWVKVGAVVIKQGNTAFNFAKQVRVEIADGKVEFGEVTFSGLGNGTLTPTAIGQNPVAGVVTLVAINSTSFQVMWKPVVGAMKQLGVATVNSQFVSTIVNFTLIGGGVDFMTGDMFSFPINYVWKRVGVFNLVQSVSPVTMNLQTELLVKAIRVVPTMFTGTDSWEVLELDILDSPPTDINNVQDLFFQENRDRDYAKQPLRIKAQYSTNDSISDLSKFGLNILDQYSFTVSYAVMVQLMGRPIVTGDIIEVIPEMQYDHNLRPVKKFLEVTDTGWASVGYTTGWKPVLYRFQAQEAIPSQETRDIFGTFDTQKYLTADTILADGAGHIDESVLEVTEETMKAAAKAVPERGSDDGLSIEMVHMTPPVPTGNAKGQPAPVKMKARAPTYVEDGLPKNGEPYVEGYQLPDPTKSKDGEYFRLYYPTDTKIAPRLHRFSAVKNRWIFIEQDRRTEYTSAKPTMHQILNSSTKQSIGKKTI